MPVLPEWARILNTTHQQYVRSETINTLRNDKLLALLQAKGRITFNNTGNFVQWPVEYKLIPVTPYADMDVISFQRHNTDKIAQLEVRGYQTSEAISKKERLMNSGMEAFVNIWDTRFQKMNKAMNRHFSGELYIDGNASANTKRLHGFESFFALQKVATVDQTLNITSTTPTNRDKNAADKVGAPDDTYAGLKTKLGDAGGSWTGSWPDGTGDSEYDYWSPLIVNWSSTDWSGAAGKWSTDGQAILRFGIMQARKNSGKEGLQDLVLLDRTRYIDFLADVQADQRVVIQRGPEASLLVRLGFGDTVNFEGVDISSEFEVGTDLGFGFNADFMELKSWQPELFVLTGPYYDENTMTWRETLDFFGNMLCNPRNMTKYQKIA